MKTESLKAILSREPLLMDPAFFEALTAESMLMELPGQTPEPKVSGTPGLVQMKGPMIREGDDWARFFGMCCMDQVALEITSAVEDASVDEIILMIDSPGGTANGTDELAEVVREAAQVKPVTAFTAGMMASAAYRVGVEATALFATPSSMLGSVGAMVPHMDVSAGRERMGMKLQIFRSGELKAPGAMGTSLTDVQADRLQEQVDILGQRFVEAVSEARPQVSFDMFDGRLIFGHESEALGASDGMVQNLAEAMGGKIPID